MRKTIVVLTLLGLALVPAALAHVEPSPEKVPADSSSKITLSAEGEESVPAVKLDRPDARRGDRRGRSIRLPAGTQSVNGRVVTWSGGKIPNGADGKFAFTAHMPNTPGRVLVFPSLVTYQDGKVVHWIGAESSDTPAPRVTLTAAKGQTNPPPPPPAPATTTTSTEGDGGSNTWIWIVIAAAILASLAASRDRPETPRVKRSLLVAVVLAALLAPGAEAHFGTGKLGYRSTITGVDPRMPGLRFKILYGDDQVWLDNRSGKTVIIKGYSGEPYLRFSPERDLRQHQLTGRLPEPGSVRPRDRFRSRRARRRSPSGRSSRAATSGPGTTTGSTT